MSRRPPWPPAAVALLACPVCGETLAPADDDAGLRCSRGHAFDRARQGHVTLLPPGHRPPSGDTAQMVADRWDVLSTGWFAGITAALAAAALHTAADGGGPPRTFLDLGGGTGQHLAAVLDRAPGACGVVLDSSPYAARRAARAHPRAVAVVADTWARLPVRDGVVDRVLVVFAPRNGPEIARVLAPRGRLVVVTPAADHLVELRGPLGLLRVDPAKAERLAGALEPHLRPLTTAVHRERLAVGRGAALALAGMGPHAHHRSRDELRARVAGLPEPVEVTLAVQITRYAGGNGSPGPRSSGSFGIDPAAKRAVRPHPRRPQRPTV